MDTRDRRGGTKVNEEILLERIQRIEQTQEKIAKTQEQIFATLRTLIRDMNYVPDVPQAPNLSVIKTTH